MELKPKCQTVSAVKQLNHEALDSARNEVNGAYQHLTDVCQALGVTLPPQTVVAKPNSEKCEELNNLRVALDTVPADITEKCREIHGVIESLFTQLN